jgi:hypothetical protein
LTLAMSWQGSRMQVFAYDLEEYPFRECVCRLLGVVELERLHEHGRQDWTLVQRQVYFYKALVGGWEAELRGLLLAFLRQEVAARLPFVPTLQMHPNFRILLHGADPVTAIHRDRDNRPEPGALKIWLPFTSVFGSNSVWVESEEGRGDLRPVELSYGEALLFDSLNLLHGSVRNDSGSTRVSADFRVRAPRPRAG